MRRGLGGRVRRLRVVAIPAILLFLAACASNAPQDTLDPDGPIANKQNNLFLQHIQQALLQHFTEQGNA